MYQPTWVTVSTADSNIIERSWHQHSVLEFTLYNFFRAYFVLLFNELIFGRHWSNLMLRFLASILFKCIQWFCSNVHLLNKDQLAEINHLKRWPNLAWRILLVIDIKAILKIFVLHLLQCSMLTVKALTSLSDQTVVWFLYMFFFSSKLSFYFNFNLKWDIEVMVIPVCAVNNNLIKYSMKCHPNSYIYFVLKLLGFRYNILCWVR